MEKLPKILIVGPYTFDGSDATSITLRNLFNGWEKDKIAFLSFTASPQQNQSTHLKFFVSQLLFGNFVINANNDSLINKVRASRSIVIGVPGAIKDKSIVTIIFNQVHTIISAYRAIIPYKYNNDLNIFIKKYKPDIIYSLLGDIRTMQMANKISSKFNIPIIPHFMDDWQNTMYSDNSFLFIPRLILLLNLRKILSRSLLGLTISQKMADEYSSRFKKQFFPLMNCVNEITEKTKTEHSHNSTEIKFCYTGGLHLDRSKSLRSICEVLQNLKTNKKITVSIYTKEIDWLKCGHEFGDFDFVKYMGFVNSDEILDKLNEQDILIHVESFDPKIDKYTRLSISTKIPEYLSLAKPIIAIGPPNIASIEYLASNQCALILSENNIKTIESKLSAMLGDAKKMESMSNNAFKLFKKNHTSNRQRGLLREIIISAASKLA